MGALRRIVIENVVPSAPGAHATKGLLCDPVAVGATAFRDGHGVVAARVRWRGPSGTWRSEPLSEGLDDWFSGAFVPVELGTHEFVIEAWTNRYETWRRDVTKWLAAGEDVAVELWEGARILEELSPRVDSPEGRDRLCAAAEALRSEVVPLKERLDAGLDDAVAAVAAVVLDPWDATESAVHEVLVERELAGRGAWYEFFPRSEGGFAGGAVDRLDAIAEMGFDVVYLPPIHPIGVTHRKGRGNTLVAGPGDPGSPWAIGSDEGGHCAVEPALGTVADFDRFVDRARELGLEVALDYALQCSPDHPWVEEHPEWFRRRVDGSIRYAENPPKRYEDIHPLEFWPSPDDRMALWEACRDILFFWADRGVRVFRVDNPHTKPVAFWEYVLAQVRGRHPDVVFLSEAFTHPAMMAKLAEVGFSQSYTYFTWRTEPWELRAYVEELVRGPAASYFRPNFWPTTPDILAGPLRNGPRAAFELRAVLAGLLSPSYGIYSGYELCENEPASPDNEEFADSEKYRIVERDWCSPASIAPLLTRLNAIRRAHPATWRLESTTFHEVDNDRLLVWSKRDDRNDDTVVVVVNTDPVGVQEATVSLDLGALRLGDGDFTVVDELNDRSYTWQGSRNYVRLDPADIVAHVFAVHRSTSEAPAVGRLPAS